MIHHVSIPADDPRRVATVLAEVMGGKCYPFPGGFRNSFMAVSGDARGTAIEVYPAGLHLVPDGDDQVGIADTGQATGYSSFHLLLSVDMELADIERIGQREGWLTRLCGRRPPNGPVLFEVIEFWLENKLMVELAPKSMIGAYEKLIQFEVMDNLPSPA